MTTVGLLYPGHAAEEDYPRIETLLTGVRITVVHTDEGGAPGADAVRETGAPERLAASMEELRLSGAEAVVWASTRGSFTHGWDGAQQQVRQLAQSAGLPASSASFGFAHAAGAVGAKRVAVAAIYPEDATARFGSFLAEAGLEVVASRAAGVTAAAEAAAWDGGKLLELVRAADHPDAQAVLVPCTAVHTVGELPALEAAVGKPVLTANQVAVWEGLRLAERHGAWSDELGALFARRDETGAVRE
ncbi:decarboxylase [Streptomyces solincola]|uniref:Decarboxylase n=1 Tax=Streptomyces solincola TaxID=2100817 RepID=A0A2S9PWS5_9ACTN|nr:decarboxylase [Streptomyces solincola]PRH78884.1 decarboxylase [Streptomyces solincola]